MAGITIEKGWSIDSGDDGDWIKKVSSKKVNYRKLAFDHYKQFGQIVCVHCGFGLIPVLEVAHLDCNRSNNQVGNLAILCPNCHKMHDIGLISTGTIIAMRDGKREVNWAKRMKDAGAKAAKARKDNAVKKKWSAAGKKAAEKRQQNAALKVAPAV